MRLGNNPLTGSNPVPSELSKLCMNEIINQNQSKEGQFAGHKKEGEWFLKKAEDKFRNKIIPYIPRFVETYHLTYLTLLWSGLIVLFGWLAQNNINWLWLVSIMIGFQYITDLFDGALGRYRNTGLIKWGYYMDHFLDYLFLSSIITAYSFLFPQSLNIFFLGILILSAGFLVSTFLSFATSNKLSISFLNFGPTEGRMGLILLNTLLIVFGVSLAQKILPYILGIEIIILFLMVDKTQKKLWKEDMELKEKKQQ